MSTVITSIDPHSPAEKAGIAVGEQLLEINGHHIVDVLDYRFYGYDPVAVLRLSKDGHTRTVTIRKDFQAERFETLSTERILDMDFQIKRYKE